MARITIAVVCGVLLGAILATAVSRLPPLDKSRSDAADDVAEVRTATRDQGLSQEDSSPQHAGSIEAVFALPSEFERAAALYGLARQADASTLHNMIYETNEIAAEAERASSLGVLFSRLAEIEPRAALALARDGDFAAIKTVERSVWRAWARKDLDGALFEAKTQTSLTHQKSAAQSLYAAFGYMENDTTRRIESELGIAPDRSTRGRYLYQLADRSPAVAIDFINALDDDDERSEYVSWLAYYVSLSDPNEALQYADQFTAVRDGEYYRRVINQLIARENPHAVIERLLASGNPVRTGGEFHSAVSALAKKDLDAAMRYFEEVQSTVMRRSLSSAIVAEMAKTDPLAALEWAVANDDGQPGGLRMEALVRIASVDPQLALTEALKTPGLQQRSNAVGSVMQQIARRNPVDAVALLEQIEDPGEKLDASQQLLNSWINQDAEAALEWILTLDGEGSDRLLSMGLSVLSQYDVDAAIKLLPRMGEQNQAGLRAQIAQQLATTYSPDRARRFIQQFEGQPGYDRLQASLISGIAQTDVFGAKQLADQLATGSARDSAYHQIIVQRAQTHPVEAAGWLSRIDNEAMRSVATGRLAALWFEHDSVAAARWVSGLPAGAGKDDAILQMSARWRHPTPQQRELIASIENREKRGQAKIRQIYNLMRSNPAEARRLLDDTDISAEQRHQVETMINQIGRRF